MSTYLLLCLFAANCIESNEIYDFIVIGSGTGGIVASRLAQERNRVLLIEAGPDDLTYSCSYNPESCVSSPFGDLIAGTPLIPFKFLWFESSVQDFYWSDAVSMPAFWNYNKTLLNRPQNLHRAKMLGGCLSHNAQIWTRGSIRDFDYISDKYDLPDWSFKNVLPFYQRLERYFGKNKEFRGQNGPIHLIERKIKKWQYEQHAFLNATLQSGFSFNTHQNGNYPQTGIGFQESNFAKYEDGTFGLFNTTHYRSSSAQSYIRDIGIKSGYLTVWYNTTVQRILFDDNISKNAIGVEYYDSNNSFTLNSIYCNKEVILSAGTYQSPQLLMLSGIGPFEELNAFNISPIQINNFIGRYGQNHLYIRYRPQINISFFDNIIERSTNHTIHNTLFNSTEYFDIFGGLDVFLSSGKYDRLGLDYNDIRFEIFGISDSLTVTIDASVYSKNLSIKLKSFDSRIYPDVYPNYYSDSRDYDIMIEGIFAARKILFDHDAFINEKNMSIEEWRDYIWKNSGPSNHVIGTVSMGADSIYPVDTNCALKGVNNLRIVDVSIWPDSTNSGTMSLAHMIGEKCAKHIIDHYKKDDDEHWWQKNQIYNYYFVGIVVISIIVFIIIGYKYYKNRKFQTNTNEEQLQLIDNRK